MKIEVTSPGKLILSGEHSVVYGESAIAIALNKVLKLTFFAEPSDEIIIDALLGRQCKKIKHLSTLKDTLDDRHQSFLLGNLEAKNLLSHPYDLIFYVLASVGFKLGGVLKINSDIPLGAGMGSSAACIAAVLKLSELIEQKQRLQSNDTLVDFAKKIQWSERLQHGKGSLIDAAAISFGGAVEVQRTQIKPIDIKLSKHWFVWHTGSPKYTTKQVVSEVAKQYAGSDIWQQFNQTTQQLKVALMKNPDENDEKHNSQSNSQNIKEAMIKNHQLLCDIGVLPPAIADTINWINRYYGAAKICGAGSLPDDQSAGQVLVYLPDLACVDVLESKNIQLLPLTMCDKGVYVSKSN